jgi:hypothetical protein
MEYMHKIKKMLCKELEEYGEKKSLSSADVEMIHKLTDTVKNLDKIEMLEGDDGYSETYPYYMGGSSYAGRGRGRGRYAKRDSMGRYSSEDGLSYDDYSEARMDRRYSRDDAKDHMMNKLGEMMSSADEEQREILKDAMRKIERA